MGLYATTTSFVKLIPYLIKGNTTTSDIETVNSISYHIDRAESMVNSYISARYSLPLSTVPPELRRLSEDIASFNIIRGVYVNDNSVRNDFHKEYERALKELESIKEGDTKLAYTDGSVVTTKSSTRMLSSTESYTPIFQLDDAGNWDVDNDQLDDISTARS